MNLLIVGTAANVTDHLFVEALYFKARDLLNPGLELRSALWIIKARQFLCGVKQPRFYDLIDRNRIFRKDRINADAARSLICWSIIHRSCSLGITGNFCRRFLIARSVTTS